MKNARHEAIAPYVDDALRNGESFFPLKESDNVKSLQKFVHKRAGKGKVKTYQTFLGELAIQKNSILSPSEAISTSNYKPGVIAEVIGQKVPSLQAQKSEYITKKYEFKVGDAGITACGENYVVLEKKKDGRLLVNVKSLGSWNIGLRNSDGTCIYNYTNKQRFALIPPKQPKKQIRTVYLNVYEDNTDVFCHATEADAKLYANDNARAVAIPVTFEFTPLR